MSIQIKLIDPESDPASASAAWPEGLELLSIGAPSPQGLLESERLRPLIELLIPPRRDDPALSERIESLGPIYSELLGDYFKEAFSRFPLGYAIFFDKPAVVMEPQQALYPQLEEFGPDFEWDRLAETASELLREVFPEIGERFALITRPLPAEYAEEPASETWLLNRGKLAGAFEENADIFREAFGPAVTFRELWKGFSAGSEETFARIDSSQALLGIVLGFGRESALAFASRQSLEDASKSDPALLAEYLAVKAAGHHLFEKPVDTVVAELLSAAPSILQPGQIVWGSPEERRALDFKIAREKAALQWLRDSPDFLERVIEAMQP